MKNFFIIFIMTFLTAGTLVAQQTTYENLDKAIDAASKDIITKCKAYDIKYKRITRLVIYDFDIDVKSANKKSSRMPQEIANQFEIFLQSSYIVPVLRNLNEMQLIEQTLVKQHKAGIYNPSTIVSVGNRVAENTAMLGKLDVLGGKYRLYIKLLDLEKGTTIYSYYYKTQPSGEFDELFDTASRVSLGFGAEINLYSHELFSPAISVSFDYNIYGKMFLGFKIFASNEVGGDLLIFEPLGSLRFYFVSPSGVPGTGVFLEGLVGVSIISNDSEKSNCISFGGGLGYRFPVKNFYIEPEIRFGYPYTVGAGLGAGFRF